MPEPELRPFVMVLVRNLDDAQVTSEVNTGDLFPGDGDAYMVVAARLRVQSVSPGVAVTVDFYGTLQERRDLVARLADQVGMTATVLGVNPHVPPGGAAGTAPVPQDPEAVPPHQRHALSPEVATALDGKPCAHCLAEGGPCWVHER